MPTVCLHEVHDIIAITGVSNLSFIVIGTHSLRVFLYRMSIWVVFVYIANCNN